MDALALRRATGMKEVRVIAEIAVAAGEQRGAEPLRSLLDAFALDLTQISKLLGAPRRPGEPPGDLLIRLLRLPLTRKDLRQLRFTMEDSQWRVAQLSAVISVLKARPRSRSPPADLTNAPDEFDALLRELEANGDPPTRVVRGSTLLRTST
jgi:hypothetical protein